MKYMAENTKQGFNDHKKAIELGFSLTKIILKLLKKKKTKLNLI